MSREELLALPVMPTSMSAEELEDFALKHLVVSYQEQGLSAAESLKRAECSRTPAWATKWRRRFQEFGAAGLLDMRQFNGREPKVMTTEVQNIVLKFWHGLPAAGTRLVWKKVREECERKKLPLPSQSSIKAYIESLPEPVKLTRGGRFEVYNKQARPTLRFRPTTYANERHQSDHNRLDIWSRRLVGGEWEPVQLWFTPLLDDYSRAIVGMALTVGAANSWSITQAIRHAVLPKSEPGWEVHGLPEVFQCDRGADFISHAVTTALAILGVSVDLDPPYYPNRKGKIERFFQTLDQGCLRALPGHMAAIGTSEGAARKHIHKLLAPEQIEREIKRWIVEEYHQRTHSVTGRKPLELWQETVRLRCPDEGDVFRVLLRMDNATRKVQPVVRFRVSGSGGDYWSPDLLPLYGKQVRVAYNPEDMRRIALHCERTGEFLAEPWLLGHPECPFDVENVISERNMYRRGLRERINQYKRELESEEMAARDSEEWQQARAAVADQPDPEPEPADVEAEEVEAILREMQAQSRKTD